MQLADLKSKPHGGHILRVLIDHTICKRFYPPLGSDHHKPLHLDSFFNSTHIQSPYKIKQAQYNMIHK